MGDNSPAPITAAPSLRDVRRFERFVLGSANWTSLKPIPIGGRLGLAIDALSRLRERLPLTPEQRRWTRRWNPVAPPYSSTGAPVLLSAETIHPELADCKFSAAGPPPPSEVMTNLDQPIHQPVRTTPMPSPQKVWIRKVYILVRELERTDLTHRHVLEYRRVCREAGTELAAAGIPTTPHRFGDRHFDLLFYGLWRRRTPDRSGIAPQTQAYNFCLLGRFLERFGNTTVKRRLSQIRIPKYQVRPITPPTEEQANRILGAAMRLGVEPGAFVALELLGLRRSSVLRLRVGELREDLTWADVWVKNKGGERKEELRIPPFVRVRLLELLAHRAQELAGVEGPDSGHLFCHVLGGKVVPWSKAYVDRHWIVPAFRDAGVVMPGTKSHGLRKATATALSDRGVPIEKVARQLHHQDVKTTLRYIRSARQDLESNATVLEEAFGKGAEPATEEP